MEGANGSKGAESGGRTQPDIVGMMSSCLGINDAATLRFPHFLSAMVVGG